MAAAFQRDSMMPRNKAGRPIRAADYNRSNSFSPGQIIAGAALGSTCAAVVPCPLTTWRGRSRSGLRSS